MVKLLKWLFKNNAIDEEESTLVYSALRTPDGTLLRSRYRHDYREYRDTVSNERYIIDGGLDYLRSSINTVPATYITFYYESYKIDELREYWDWGSYGYNGEEDLHFILLKNLTEVHINNILENCDHISHTTVKILNDELNYRRGI